MKKNLFRIIFLISLFIIPNTIFAAGGLSVSTTNISITQGSSSSFTINANNAAGGVSISSSNSGVASVSMSSTFLDNSGATVTVTGKAVGSAVITVTAFDMATYDEEVVSTVHRINVTVKAKPTYTPPPADTRSTNTNLSKVTINGKEIKKDGDYYRLNVSNYVTSVDINSVVQDSKSKVVNPGKKDLAVGDNVFDIVVTAEKGNTATHKVLVNRSQYNTIDDLDELIKLNKNFDINMGESLELSEEQLNKIIQSKKTFGFNKYDDQNKLIYSWVLSGEIISSVGKFNLVVNDKLEDNEAFKKAFNYADGVFLDFSDCIEIPKGVVFKYFIDDKYNKDDVIYLYTYDDENGEVSKIKDNVSVKNSFLELGISDTVKHFASQTVVANAKDKSEVNTWMFVSIGEGIFVVLLIIFFIIIYSKKGKPKKEKPVKINKEDIPIVTNVTPSEQSNVQPIQVVQTTQTIPVQNTQVVQTTPVVQQNSVNNYIPVENNAPVVDTSQMMPDLPQKNLTESLQSIPVVNSQNNI